METGGEKERGGGVKTTVAAIVVCPLSTNEITLVIFIDVKLVKRTTFYLFWHSLVVPAAALSAAHGVLIPDSLHVVICMPRITS